MRRFLLLLSVVFATTSIFAELEQIPNTFYGITIGKSSTTDVSTALKSQGSTLVKKEICETLDNVITYHYKGKYQNEGFDFTNLKAIFCGDTLFAVCFIDSSFTNVQERTQTLLTTLEEKYDTNFKENIDNSVYFSQLQKCIIGKQTWKISDIRRTLAYSYSDSIVSFTYFNTIKNMALISYNLLQDYSEKNKVYGVAGVNFGDKKYIVKRIINQTKGYSAAEEKRDALYYKNFTLGGTTYDHAFFKFDKNNKFISAVFLSTTYYREALLKFESIKNQYSKKYSNLKTIADEYETKLVTCGAYIDGYDYHPIRIAFVKSVDDTQYTVGVMYYSHSDDKTNNDEI